MNRPLKKTIAILLTFCSLLALIVPPVFATPSYSYTSAELSPTTLKEGVIYNSFGLSQYYGLGVVNGHDYLYVPYNHMLYVYDLDTWEKVDEQEMADGTSIGAFVDSSGIVWVYGAKKSIYRYDPTTKSGSTISASSIMGSTIDKLYSPIEVDGMLYFGTYGTAAGGGACILKYDPNAKTWTNLGKLADNAMYCSAMTYHNGYIYATAQSNKAENTPQAVVKFDLNSRTVVDSLNIHQNTSTAYYSTVSYFDDIQIAGDIMFIGGNPQSKMLAIDISGSTMKFATGLTNMPTAGIMRGISEEVNGKIYFFTYNRRSTHNNTTAWTNYNDFYSYDVATKTFTKLNTGNSQTGDIRSPQKSIVTIQNDALGLNGQYILTASIYPKTHFVLYGLDGSRHEMPDLPEAYTANRLTSFTKGPDGTNTIYMGSYMNPTAAVYNYATGNVTLQTTYSNQLSQNFHYNGKWYVTNYGACSLSEVTLGSSDNTGTVKTLFSLNEGANKGYFNQERMQNFTGGGNKVFTSTVPHKGLLGGYIAWYDYDEKATYVAVEDDLVLYAKDGAPETWYNAKTDALYTFSGKFDGLVANQMIKTLVYYDGLIYASTTAYGGSQSTPLEGETAKLIVYDPTNMEMVATYDIRDGISGLASNIQGITGIVADPDVPGRFWGKVSGTLFYFTFDKDTKTFNVQEVLSHSKANSSGASPAQFSPWKCYFDDGYLYYFDGTENDGWINMVSTVDPTYYAKLHANTRSFFVLGEDDNIYCAKGTEILKYNTASIVAQVKANGPTGEPGGDSSDDPIVTPTANPLTYIFNGNNQKSSTTEEIFTLTQNADFMPDGANAAWQYVGRTQNKYADTVLQSQWLLTKFKTASSTNGMFVAVRLCDVEAATYQMNFYGPNAANVTGCGKADILILNQNATYTTEDAAQSGINAAISSGAYTSIGVFDSSKDSATAQTFTHTFETAGDYIVVFRCTSGQTGNCFLKLSKLIMTPAPVATNGGTGYSTLQAAISATANASDKAVKLIVSTAEDIDVPQGVTLDLNGKTLKATSFTCKGTLTDSSDGRGLVATTPGKSINVAADDLLLYDSAKTGYRVYNNFTVAPHANSTNLQLDNIDENTRRLWINVSFTNPDAYRVIANGISGISIGAALTWTPDGGTATTANLVFADDVAADWATKIAEGKNVGFYIQFTGFERLVAGTLKLTPFVNEVSSTTSITHTHIAG